MSKPRLPRPSSPLSSALSPEHEAQIVQLSADLLAWALHLLTHQLASGTSPLVVTHVQTAETHVQAALAGEEP